MEPDRRDAARSIAQLSGNGAHGHVVQIVDPAEETFPYSGRVEFIEPEGVGSITAGRAETWRADYQARLARHRDEIRAETDQLGWSFTIHRTDRPASELLLALHARIGERQRRAMTQPPAARPAQPREARHDRACRSALPQPLVLLGLLSLPVLWWLLRLVPPRPRRIEFPADAAAVRDRAEGRNAGAHAVVAHAAAADARGAGHHRRRRAAVESAARDHEPRRADRCC